MISCSSVSKRGRIGFSVGPVLAGLLVLSGCTNEYTPDMRYPPRTDPIVSQSLGTQPSQIDKPGDFPNVLADLKDEDKKYILYPDVIASESRGQLQAMLEEAFGTPAEPKVKGLGDDEREKLRLGQKDLTEGSTLYRIHCLHCHGLTGNGRGTTAPWVNPHPRDYRQGLFKFTSTDALAKNPYDPDKRPLGNGRKPTRADLQRTLREGIEGTSMPAFSLLTNAEVNALISYVLHLSMRGEVEFLVMKTLLKDPGSDVKETFDESLTDVKGYWLSTTDPSTTIRPAPDVQVHFPPTLEQKEAVLRGWDFFKSASKGGCIGCHQDYGRQGNYFYDAWGTIGRPADLTMGTYRGGRRPIDLYYRIHSGVNGSNMPASGDRLKAQEIWDLVSFLEVLPYPKMRQEFGIDIDKAEPPPERVAERIP